MTGMFVKKSTALMGGDMVLDAVAGLLKKYPTYSVQVIGHTDNKGKSGELVALSLARAQSVFSALVTRGVDPKRLMVAARAATSPSATTRAPPAAPRTTASKSISSISSRYSPSKSNSSGEWLGCADFSDRRVHEHQPRIGVDIGRVIIAGDGPDTSFFNDDYMEVPPVDGAFDGVARLVRAFAGRVWLVSKCGQKIQQRTLRVAGGARLLRPDRRRARERPLLQGAAAEGRPRPAAGPDALHRRPCRCAAGLGGPGRQPLPVRAAKEASGAARPRPRRDLVRPAGDSLARSSSPKLAGSGLPDSYCASRRSRFSAMASLGSSWRQCWSTRRASARLPLSSSVTARLHHKVASSGCAPVMARSRSPPPLRCRCAGARGWSRARCRSRWDAPPARAATPAAPPPHRRRRRGPWPGTRPPASCPDRAVMLLQILQRPDHPHALLGTVDRRAPADPSGRDRDRAPWWRSRTGHSVARRISAAAARAGRHRPAAPGIARHSRSARSARSKARSSMAISARLIWARTIPGTTAACGPA